MAGVQDIEAAVGEADRQALAAPCLAQLLCFGEGRSPGAPPSPRLPAPALGQKLGGRCRGCAALGDGNPRRDVGDLRGGLCRWPLAMPSAIAAATVSPAPETSNTSRALAAEMKRRLSSSLNSDVPVFGSRQQHTLRPSLWSPYRRPRRALRVGSARRVRRQHQLLPVWRDDGCAAIGAPVIALGVDDDAAR